MKRKKKFKVSERLPHFTDKLDDFYLFIGKTCFRIYDTFFIKENI